MKNEYDFGFCMQRDCKVCNKFLQCNNKKIARKRKFGNKKNKNRKSKRSGIQSEN